MNLTQEQARAFVGPGRADYYLEGWHRIREHGSRALGFNWGAFWFTVIWLLYRRLHREFWIAVAVMVGLLTIGELALQAALSAKARELALLIAIVNWFMPLLYAAVLGIYGTYWYYLHTRRQIGRLTPDGRTDLQTVASAGGTKPWAAVLLAVALIGVLVWSAAMRSQRP